MGSRCEQFNLGVDVFFLHLFFCCDWIHFRIDFLQDKLHTRIVKLWVPERIQYVVELIERLKISYRIRMKLIGSNAQINSIYYAPQALRWPLLQIYLCLRDTLQIKPCIWFLHITPKRFETFWSAAHKRLVGIA